MNILTDLYWWGRALVPLLTGNQQAHFDCWCNMSEQREWLRDLAAERARMLMRHEPVARRGFR